MGRNSKDNFYNDKGLSEKNKLLGYNLLGHSAVKINLIHTYVDIQTLFIYAHIYILHNFLRCAGVVIFHYVTCPS